MQNIPIYEALAEAFAAEGVDTHFTLIGDGNMHWVAALQKLPGMSTFSARHEHCACVDKVVSPSMRRDIDAGHGVR
jgi:acetolactate synthase I/II/III large subunit